MKPSPHEYLLLVQEVSRRCMTVVAPSPELARLIEFFVRYQIRAGLKIDPEETMKHVLAYLLNAKQSAGTRPEPDRSIAALGRWADLLPLGLRKQIRAMAADYEVEVQRLRAEGRGPAAQWNIALAWLTAIRMLLTGPLRWLLNAVVGAFKS